MAFNYSPKIVTDGLVLYLDAANTRSYPTTGTTWNDLSKNINNGTLINGPNFSTAFGGSILLDGSNDYISTNLQNDPTTMTFEYCARFNNVLSAFVVVGKIGSGDYWSGLWSDGTITFSMNGSTMTSGVIPIQNGFYHVVCQFTTTNRIIYVNGELKNSLVLSGTKAPGGSINLGQFIGAYYAPINLSLFRFYNRALSAQEVLQNYNATKTRFGL